MMVAIKHLRSTLNNGEIPGVYDIIVGICNYFLKLNLTKISAELVPPV